MLLAACSSQSTGNTTPTPGATTTTTASVSATSTAKATPKAASTPTTQTAWTPDTLIPPGGQLPSDATCAARVKKTTWEPRPDNNQANHTNVYASGAWRPHNLSSDPSQNYAASRVTGNFTGTTDEILQWVACKWGFPVDTVRAQAIIESYWHQNAQGDCNGGKTQSVTHGCESVGILQVRDADIPETHPGTWPYAYESTAWNADYTLGIRRACFNGMTTWLTQFNSSYKAGDLWGCIGLWYSGRFHDDAANGYIAKVQQALKDRAWTQSNF